MKILVVGATGGSGQAAVTQGLSEGHEVTAFSRKASRMNIRSERFRTVDGDAMNPQDVERAVRGQDAVIITLGISESPLRVRFLGPAKTPMDVRSTGTRNVISAMQKHSVRRLVVQSSFGVGETRDNLRLVDRLVFSLLLKPQIADTEAQEIEVRDSGVDWVLAQPVHLTDDDTDDMPFTSTDGQVREMKISRRRVARFLATAAHSPDYIGRTVAISG